LLTRCPAYSPDGKSSSRGLGLGIVIRKSILVRASEVIE
jgi:hypothetical protein